MAIVILKWFGFLASLPRTSLALLASIGSVFVTLDACEAVLLFVPRSGPVGWWFRTWQWIGGMTFGSVCWLRSADLWDRPKFKVHECWHLGAGHLMDAAGLFLGLGLYYDAGAPWWLVPILCVGLHPALYGLGSAQAWLRGLDYYRDNPFERRARRAAGER